MQAVGETSSTKDNPDIAIFKADTVYFDLDSATIKKSEDKKLEDVAAFLKAHQADALRVEGNCDERGTEKYNLSLGEKRALAVREYLVNLGVDARQVVTVTYGKAKPAVEGHNEAAWSKNRRDDFVCPDPKNSSEPFPSPVGRAAAASAEFARAGRFGLGFRLQSNPMLIPHSSPVPAPA